MSTVPSLMAENIANAYINVETWGSVIVNVKAYGAKGDGKADDTSAVLRAYGACQEGDLLYFPRGDYLLSSQLAINKSISIAGQWNRRKSGASVSYGSRLVIKNAAVQSSLESVILVNAASVKIQGIAIVGSGYSNGSIGILFRSSNLTNVNNLFIQGFDKAYKLGAGSAHVTAYDSLFTGNNDAVYFGSGNLFDFAFINCSMDGNIRSALCLEGNTSVENVTVFRSQLGYNTQYAILQEPTVTGDGYSLMSLKDSPAEQIQIQHIRMYNGGNIRVEGGYYTWANGYQPANAIFKIDRVNVGPIWFSPKLEVSYPNPNSPSVIEVTGYSNYNLYVEGSLNGTSQKWFNYGASLDMRKLYVNGRSCADQNYVVKNLNIDNANTDQEIILFKPLVAGGFIIDVSVKTTSTSDVSVKLFFNDGNAARTVYLLPQYVDSAGPTVTLAAGHYSYFRYFAYCTTFNNVVVTVKSSVAGIKVTSKVSMEI